MADQFISLKIPSAKVAVVKTGFFKIYPNIETIDDPTWVDPEDGTLVDQIPKYTDKEWFTEKLRRIIVRDVHRGLRMIAVEGVIL